MKSKKYFLLGLGTGIIFVSIIGLIFYNLSTKTKYIEYSENVESTNQQKNE